MAFDKSRFDQDVQLSTDARRGQAQFRRELGGAHRPGAQHGVSDPLGRRAQGTGFHNSIVAYLPESATEGSGDQRHSPTLAAMTEPAVRLEDVRLTYGPTVALDGITADIPAHQLTALLGPNGAGKSSTVDLIIGFRRPDSGTVTVLGRPAADPNPQQSAAVGVMLQGAGIPPGARSVPLLQTYAAYYQQPWPVDDLVERLGLGDVRAPFRRMSGGEQQRLKLALALIGRPELVIVDEPTAGMDPAIRRDVWALFTQLIDAGTTILLTTHDMAEAAELATRVIILDAGHIVADDLVASLVGSDEELTFIAPSGLPLDDLRVALPEAIDVRESPVGRYRVRGAIDPMVVSTVTAWASRHDASMSQLRIGTPTLEDVFLARTGRSYQQ